jgi:glutamate carboxypeptidase
MVAGVAARLLLWLDEHEEEMVALLERLVRAESPSTDRGAQSAPFEILAVELERIGYAVRRVPGGVAGDHLYARPLRRLHGDPRQLLIGHMDTVWPVGTLAQMPVRREDGLLFGPGTADMKGGLVEIVFALRALHELGLEPAAMPVVVVNTDEEIGSVDSTALIGRLARGAVRAFVLEAGEGGDGRLKIARKGIASYTVTVRGRPAHAGAAPEHGVSAILELSHQVQRLFALNDPARGVTVNVGTIDGGLRPNVVAPAAIAIVDVRVPTTAAAHEVDRKLRGLTPVLEGATLEVQGSLRRPPMEPLPRNRTLLAAARRLGHELGMVVGDAGLVGGGSDANTTSVHTATLDGLGPIGAGSHAVDERVDTTRLPGRTALLALLLLEPLQHPCSARPPRDAWRRRAPSSTRVALIGTEASGTSVEIVAAWRALGIDAALVARPAATARLAQLEAVVGRLDVLPTLEGVEPGLFELLLLERRGLRVLNRAAPLTAVHDKLLTARLLGRAGLPHPRTEHLRRGDAPALLEPPLVLKPRFGSWGVDVFRCETWAELRRCLAEIRTRPWFARQGVLVQELVPPVGHDLRLVVGGDRVVGAARRVASPGEWRTNATLGATRSPVVPPPAAAALAIAAAAAVHADLVGVDLLPCGDGFTVIELNGAADFNGTYSLPGRDVFEDAAAALALLPRAAA